MMDKIDVKLLKTVERISGAQTSEIFRLARGMRSETQLRNRLIELEGQGFVALDRESERGKVFCSITKSGKAVLKIPGREEITPSNRGDTP